jgi:hypothetical protein
MSDPVEAVARAICRQVTERDFEDLPEAHISEVDQDDIYQAAQCAIAAYHEALEADGWRPPQRLSADQFCAGHTVIEKWAPEVPASDRDYMLIDFCRAMIQAAPTPKDRDHESGF